jgi:hypothetical protein
MTITATNFRIPFGTEIKKEDLSEIELELELYLDLKDRKTDVKDRVKK